MSDTTTRPAAILDRDGDTWTPTGPSRKTYRVTTCTCVDHGCLGTEMSLEDIRSEGIVASELAEETDDAAIVARLRARRAEALADMEATRGVNQTQFAVHQVLVEVLSQVLDGD